MIVEQADVAAFLKAMENTFDAFSMQRLMLERFDIKLGNITSVMKPFDHQVVDVHLYFRQRNTSEELVAGLRDARPNEPVFVRLADKFGFSEAPAQSALEVLVNKGAPHQDAEDFRLKLMRLEDAVCRVETPHSLGTGTLIGKRLVLTNHHVVAQWMTANQPAGRVTCVFGDKKSVLAAAPVLKVNVVKVLASSAHAPEDLQPEPENTDPKFLDFALLQLDKDVGDLPMAIDGEPRGWARVAAHKLKQHDGVLVLQHPLGQKLKTEIGAITKVGTTRVRHSVNTQSGSSGSAVLNNALEVVALHHSGYDWPDTKFPFNRAIPWSLIAAHLSGLGIQV